MPSVSRTAPKVVYAGSIFTPASPIERATPPIVRGSILDTDEQALRVRRGSRRGVV
jgi:hypothetical protein